MITIKIMGASGRFRRFNVGMAFFFWMRRQLWTYAQWEDYYGNKYGEDRKLLKMN